MKVQCMSCVVIRAEKTYIYFCIKYLGILLWLYGFNNLVNHLKFNNIRFTKLLIDSYFLKVQKDQRNH
jgi:hypothetical protein